MLETPALVIDLHQGLRGLLLGSLCIALLACGPDSAAVSVQAVPLKQLHFSKMCRSEQPGIFQIHHQQDLSTYFRPRMLGKALPKFDFDFQQVTVLVVASGALPSSAFRLIVRDEGAHQIAQTLTLPVWVEDNSSDNKRHAQIVTRQCVLLVLPKGNYVRVEALQGDVSLVLTTVPATP